MAVTPGSLIQEGTRVRVRRAGIPLDPGVVGRTGLVVDSTEYRAHSYGVVLDGEEDVRMFMAAELEVTEPLALPADREQAKRRSALP